MCLVPVPSDASIFEAVFWCFKTGAQHRQTLVAVLVQMLNTPALNGALRKQAGEVVEAVSEIMVSFINFLVGSM